MTGACLALRATAAAAPGRSGRTTRKDRLRGAGAYYAARGQSVPWNSWEVVGRALRAATVHEWRGERGWRPDPTA